jgi:aconitate hydratase
MFIYGAAMRYAGNGVALVVLAGKEYGAGSSRDWAAKGTTLLGVRAVIAESFERIHRSNLIGMGVIPLQFPDGESVDSLGLTGEETFEVGDLEAGEAKSVTVTASREGASQVEFEARVRLDTPNEILYFRNGGILHRVLRDLR